MLHLATPKPMYFEWIHDKDMPTWIINNPDANGNKKGEVFYILGVVLCMPNATKTSISIKLS